MEFVNVDEAGKFFLSPLTKKHLYTVRGPLLIVSVVGRYRTGKSSLLNHLIGVPRTFTTSPSVQAQTKGLGLHICHEDSKTICLIDTEGFGSVQATTTHDTSIFALAMLVSSGCFFNNLGTITSQNLRDLRLAARVAGMLTSCSKMGITMPPIVWVLRDFVLQLRDAHGFIMSPSEYLEDCIDNVTSSDVTSDIRTLFPNRDALTVPRPCDTDEDIQEMTNVKQSFIDAMNNVRKRMLLFPPKSRQNQTLDGRDLCDLVEALCHTLNTDGTLPNMDDMWATIMQKSIDRATDMAISTFLAESTITTGIREGFDVFQQQLGNIEPSADQIINLTHLFLARSEKWDESKTALVDLQRSSKLYQEKMDERHSQLLLDIVSYEERCKQYETRLQETTIESLGHTTTIKNLKSEHAINTHRLEELETKETVVTEHIQERFLQLRTARDTLQTEVDRLTTEKEHALSKYEDTKHQCDSMIQKVTSFRKCRDSSETQIADMHRELRALHTDIEVWKARYADMMERHTVQYTASAETKMDLVSTKVELEYLRKTKTEQDTRISTLSQENNTLRHDVKKLQLFKSTFV